MKKLLGFFIVIIPVIVIMVVIFASKIVGVTVDIPVTDIKLKAEAGTMAINTSFYMEYEVLPNKAQNRAVVFKSSNEEVAKVDQSGVVTFVGFGTAHIQVMTIDGAKTKSCIFNVVSDSAFGINLTSSKSELTVGDIAQVNATVFPVSAIDKRIYFSSSNSEVASVNANGVVTGKSCGDVTITATTADKNVFQTLNLTVAQKAIGIEFGEKEIVTETGIVSLQPIFNPLTTSEKYRDLVFKSSDLSIATVSKDGLVSFLKSGQVSISVTTSYGVDSSVRIFYTGGLPADFSCGIGNKVTAIFDEQQLYNNCGNIPLEFSVGSSVHNVTYKSSNPNIVSVDEFGMYSILGGGKAYITINVEVAKVERNQLIIEYKEHIVEFEITRLVTSIDVQKKVSISQSEYNLKATALPADATSKLLTYRSLDETIATVDGNGNVKFKKAGTAKIEVSSSNNISSVCAITSTMGYPTSAVINEQNNIMQVNSMATLTVLFNSSEVSIKNGQWSVLDANVCSVNQNGQVKALAEGNTKVFFTFQAWLDNQIKQVVISTDVQVYKNIELVTINIALQKVGDLYVTALPSFDIGYTYLPSDATHKFTQFICLDESVAKVDSNGKVYFIQKGTARFLVKCVGGGNNEFQSGIVSVEYTAGAPKSIELNVGNTASIWLGEHIDISVNESTVIPSDCKDLSFELKQSKDNFVLNGKKLTSVAVGISTVSAVFKNGVSINCQIEVKQPVTSINLVSDINKDGVTFNKVVNLIADINPQNAFNKKVNFVSSDLSIATVSPNGVVTFAQAGSVDITATADDGLGATAIIKLRSTFGSVEQIDIENLKIITNIPLSYKFYPTDVVGVSVNSQVLSQSPHSGADDVLQRRNGILYGYNAGTAVVKTSITNPNGTIIEKTNTVTVEFSSNKITNFVVDDIQIFEGESVDIKSKIKNIVPSDIDPLYIKYMKVKYTSDAEIDRLTITDGVICAIKYGIYNVTVEVDGVKKVFVVTVYTNSSNISVDNLSIDNIKNSQFLSSENETIAGQTKNVVVSSASLVELGLPRTIASNALYVIQYSYMSSDESVATVDSNGAVKFLRNGIVEIFVKQVISGNGLTSVLSLATKDTNIFIRYYDTVQSFDCKVGETPLSKTEPNVFTYNAIDNTITLTYFNVLPKKAVTDSVITIENSRPNTIGQEVLSVVNGKLTMVHGGTAVIKVAVGNVVNAYTIKVVRLVDTIVAQDDLLTSSKNIQLTAPTFLPSDATDKGYSFESSDTSVATVTDGILRFIKAGSVTVTARSTDKNAQDTFIVKSTFGGIVDFNLKESSVTINKNNVYNILHTVTPSDGTEFVLNYIIISQSANGGGSLDVISLNGSVVTAIAGGTATVRVSATNAFGELKTKDLVVNVVEKTSSLALDKPNIADVDAEGRYITAVNKIKLSARAGALTANDLTLLWTSSDSNVATVDALGNVTFKATGFVTISVRCNDNVELNQSVVFNYVGDRAISVVIDSFSGVLNLGDKIIINVNKIVPQDLTNIKYVIQVIESIPNGGVGEVLLINNNIITANCGGRARVRITINGVQVGIYDITVKSPITSIAVTETVNIEDVMADVGTVYQINPSVSPLHADKLLGFTVMSGDGVTVDANGLVKLLNFTTAKIKVYSTENVNLFKLVTINYTEKVLQQITIEGITGAALFGGTQHTLIITAHYNTSSKVLNNAEVTLINNSPLLIDVDTQGTIRAKNDVYGTANVDVRFGGKVANISFVVAPAISHIGFALNNAEDNLGIKGERVFGTHFFNSINPSGLSDVTTAYKLAFDTLTHISVETPLVWTSSNENVATVDGNGVVTIKTHGQVTISCKPKYQYGDEHASYTFKFVKGINVYNIGQYELFTSELAANSSRIDASGNIPAVLHTDIIYDASYIPNFWADSGIKEGAKFRTFRAISNLYGNGHTINTSYATHTTYKSPQAFQIYENNVKIDNVTLIGFKYADETKPNLADFNEAGSGTTIGIRGYGNQHAIRNIVIKNSVIMNGRVNIEAYSAQFALSGCIVKNAFQGNIVLNTFASMLEAPSDATLKNCVVENSLTPSIELKVDKENIQEMYSNKLTIVGDLYINNWRREEDIPKKLDSTQASQIKTLFKLLKENKELCSGEYINFGISRISAEIYANKFPNYGKVYGLPAYCKYATMTYNYIGNPIKMELNTYFGNAIPTLPGMNAPLGPGTVINSTIYEFIRDTSV
ncbi:MAG: Ig-like domain-containing protein [Clostridia bacterium]